MTTSSTSVTRRALAAALSIAITACATTMSQSDTGGVAAAGTISPDASWPVSAREHVDLWLHGYALLTGDTARVPFFRRGYRQTMRQVKSSRGAYTQLDANADQLSARFRVNPGLVNGQFLPFYFSSFQQMQQ